MTKHHYHAVIWIDHREARVFHFNPTEVDKLILHPDNPTRHIHHKANSIASFGLASLGGGAMIQKMTQSSSRLSAPGSNFALSTTTVTVPVQSSCLIAI